MSTAAAESGIAPPLPIVAASDLLTPEGLLALPDEQLYELVDGKLVERKIGNWASFVATRLTAMLDTHVQGHGLGWVFNSDSGFRLSPDSPKTIRKPDVSFVTRGRLPDDTPSRGYDALAPDLAVEVLSPHDLALEVDFKREEYRRAGVRLIWIVYPETRTIEVFRADGTTSFLHEQDELSGEDVIPGFRCPVASAFGMAATVKS